MQSFLDGLIARTGIPGVSVTVILRGSITTATAGIASVRRGTRMTARSRFRIGCLTHFLLNVMILRLVADGDLDMDAPVAGYLSELSASLVGRISIRNLISHTSGFQPPDHLPESPDAARAWEQFVGFLRVTPLLFAPGTVFSYHIYDDMILHRLLEVVTGHSFERNLHEWLLRPLGLTEDGARRPSIRDHVDDHLLDRSNGCYRRAKSQQATSAFEKASSETNMPMYWLAAIAARLLAGSAPPGPRIKTWEARVADLLMTEAIALPPLGPTISPQRLPKSYGLGCPRYADGTFGYTGSVRGQCCAIQFDPRKNYAVAVAVNARELAFRDEIANWLSRRITPSGNQAAEPSLRDAASGRSTDIDGRYVSAKDGIWIGVETRNQWRYLTVSNPAQGSHEELCVAVDPSDTSAHAEKRISTIPIRFFSEPTVNAACMMYGLRAFRRVQG